MLTRLYTGVSRANPYGRKTDENGAGADYDAELQNWLINAFNGEWLKVDNAVPIDNKKRSSPAEPRIEQTA